jgi:hypothetical protein
LLDFAYFLSALSTSSDLTCVAITTARFGSATCDFITGFSKGKYLHDSDEITLAKDAKMTPQQLRDTI